MKKIICCFIVLVCFGTAHAQANKDSIPIYLQFPFVPPFSLMKVPDSTRFTKDDLKKKKNTIVIVFSPDCDHCQHEMTDILSHYKSFKKTQIVMASYLNFDLIKKFYEDYKLVNYPNITMGRDAGYFLGEYFQHKFFPAIYIYNKKGKFIKEFQGSTPIEKIIEVL